VEFNSPDITIKGYIGKPTISRGNRNFENYFINGRYIKNHIITKAIEEAYKPFMMQHKYPFTSLYYEINPSLLDVNVHPQKMELKINNGEQVYQITYNLIKDSLSKKELIPKISLSKNDQKKVTQEKLPEPFEKNRISNLKALETLAAYQPMDNRQSANYSGDHISTNTTDIGSNISGNNKEDNQPIWDQINNSDIIKENHSYEATVNTANNIEVKDQLGLFSDFLSKEAVKDHRILGQIFSTYWLVEYQKELYIIDQHAAHEKVLYERILKAAKNNKHTSQMLLPPIVLTLSLKEQEAIKTHNKILEQLGYEIEHFGGNEFSIRAVPADLYNLSDKDLFLEFIDELTQELGFGQGDPLSILEKIASMACKSAVKANHILSTEEASSLIKELLTLENPYHCPHGRPVIISISRYELEKKFKRII
jgi:DNA mismatch repair protein MutL